MTFNINPLFFKVLRLYLKYCDLIAKPNKVGAGAPSDFEYYKFYIVSQMALRKGFEPSHAFAY